VACCCCCCSMSQTRRTQAADSHQQLDSLDHTQHSPSVLHNCTTDAALLLQSITPPPLHLNCRYAAVACTRHCWPVHFKARALLLDTIKLSFCLLTSCYTSLQQSALQLRPVNTAIWPLQEPGHEEKSTAKVLYLARKRHVRHVRGQGKRCQSK
jgi:hypothetical protein